MNHDPKFRYFKCEGDALEILKAYKAELEALAESHVKLHDEFNERSTKLQEHHQANLRGLWRRMAALVGLDPDKTWGKPEYQIEARYLADGFGAITFAPQLPHPLQELLGGDPVEQPEDPTMETAPDKNRLN